MKILTDFRKTVESGEDPRLFVYPPMINLVPRAFPSKNGKSPGDEVVL